MAVVGRDRIDVEKFGKDIEVNPDPRARLMYYVHSMCTVLDLKDADPDINRLTKYWSFRLTEDEKQRLIILGYLLNPTFLLGKCIFLDDELCGKNANDFFKLSAVQNRFLVTSDIVIGGTKRTVHKIMACRKYWLDIYWVDAMKQLVGKDMDELPSQTPQRPSTGQAVRGQGQRIRVITVSSDRQTRQTGTTIQSTAVVRRPATATPTSGAIEAGTPIQSTAVVRRPATATPTSTARQAGTPIQSTAVLRRPATATPSSTATEQTARSESSNEKCAIQ
ncbi:hypothetical protein ACJMK2_004865 [Sinanodonta woodiana]|uniref:Uncharacterized protein n=1 Tax=Sinanodonta woodiana TaxID=1069815 RepID=A0ABD3VNA9_SINWO